MFVGMVGQQGEHKSWLSASTCSGAQRFYQWPRTLTTIYNSILYYNGTLNVPHFDKMLLTYETGTGTKGSSLNTIEWKLK